MLYKILKLLVTVGIRFYYREIKIKNRHHLDCDSPAILVANHPNTLMDAWMMGYVSHKPIYFMAKATFFNSPLKLRILSSLNMIPINRAGEGKTNGVNNTDSFEACYQLLESGRQLVIFPEGTSYLERHLRELKTGTARIALEAEKRRIESQQKGINEEQKPLKIIPIGLNYLEANRFRSSVLVQVGSAISVQDYVSDYLQNTGQASRKLTEAMRVRMEQLLVNMDEKEEELLVESLHKMLHSHYLHADAKGVEGELLHIREIRDAVQQLTITKPWVISEIRDLMKELEWKVEKFAIRADFLDRRFRSWMFIRQLVFSMFFILFALPFFAYGALHNIFQYTFTDYLIPKITKEVEYFAPLAVLLGLILYPLTYLGFVALVDFLVDLSFWQQFIYFWSMPVFGFFAFGFFKYLKHISFKWKFIFLAINNKDDLRELQQKRKKLRDLLND
jgi:1-acyl-sn-glycerol-3-phosphate acyltransferase